MPGNVVTVRLVTDSKDLEKGFNRAEKSAVAFGSAVGTLAGNFAYDLGRKAVRAITDFVGESADAFSALEQAVGGTQAVFGDTADVIDGVAATSARAMGLSEAAFRTATTGIGGQLKRLTGDVQYAADTSIFLTKTAADLAATYGGTTAEAVTALGAAFRGEADPAERFNLDLKIGRVNAKALEMGLVDAEGKVTDYGKAQAVVALVTEQSADAQGQFARETDTAAGRTQILTAEIENQQAALGETAAEWQLFWLKQKSNVAIGGSVVLNWFSAFSDDVTGAERDLRDFEIRTGTTANTAAAAVAIWKDYGTAIVDLLPIMGMSRAELEKLRDADEEYLKSLGWTEEGIRKVDKAIDDQIRKVDAQAQATASAGDIIAGNLVPALEDQTDATDDLADATGDANDEIRTQIELIRDQHDALKAAYDPAFAYMRAQRDLAAAQAAYNAAVDEFGDNSPEAVAAAEDIADANWEIQNAVTAIGEKGVPAAMDALRRMGVPPAVIAQFENDAARIQEIFRNLNLRVGVTVPTLYPSTPSGGGVGWTSKSKTYYHQGGVVPGMPGQEVPAVLKAGETVLPTHDRNLMRGVGGPSLVVNLTVNAGLGSDPNAVARAVVEALQRYSRHNGTIRGVSIA